MNRQKLRVLMAFVGVLLLGIGVGFLKNAHFGVDPYQCFIGAFEVIVPINLGTLYILINIVLVAIMFFIGRSYIGVCTFINMFFLGYFIEYAEAFLAIFFGNAGFVLRIVLMIVGFIILCFASALIFTANLGISTYDVYAIVMADKKIAKFAYCRIGTDLFCVLFGIVFGVYPGVATIMTAFFMGPLITVFRDTVSEPLLAKYPQ